MIKPPPAPTPTKGLSNPHHHAHRHPRSVLAHGVAGGSHGRIRSVFRVQVPLPQLLRQRHVLDPSCQRRLLKESVTFAPSASAALENTALYVLVQNTTANGTATNALDPAAIAANHNDWEGYTGPFAAGNEMGVTGWQAVVGRAGPSPSTLVIDLSQLDDGRPRHGNRSGAGSGSGGAPVITAIRYAAGATFNHSRLCCGPHVDVTREPCAPESCPIKATGLNTLPGSPFFAQVLNTGKCRCFAPQTCDE